MGIWSEVNEQAQFNLTADLGSIFNSMDDGVLRAVY